MRRIDTTQAILAEHAKEDHIATLQTMLEGQLAAIEKVLEGNVDRVCDPGAWNVVAGFMDQLRFWLPRMFYPADVNVVLQGQVPEHPLHGAHE